MNRKRKAILYGLGRYYKEYRSLLFDLFEVIAVSDLIRPSDEDLLIQFMGIDMINSLEYDNLIICSERYKDSILVQLYNTGIPLEKMIFLSDLVKAYNPNNSKYESLIKDITVYSNNLHESRFSIQIDDVRFIDDRHGEAGNPSTHYFAQDLWAAKKIYIANPKTHYDIASRIDGFIAHLLVFREVNYIDIRPLPYEVNGLHFVQGAATNLETFKDKTVESLSCLHAMEHFGLGRYGDPINPNSYLLFAQAVQRVMKPGGHLYLGVPVGPKDKCVFNAHRIFNIRTILEIFDSLELLDIGIIGPRDVEVKSIEESDYNFVEDYSCGVFEFVK